MATASRQKTGLQVLGLQDPFPLLRPRFPSPHPEFLAKKYLHNHAGSTPCQSWQEPPKTLVQPPHFLGNETESQRDKVSEFLPREPRPAESSTPSSASPLPSPTNTPSESTLHPGQAQSPGSRWQSPRSRGRRGRRDHGARREESLTGPDPRGPGHCSALTK